MKTCDDCQYGKRLYADGFIYRDWSGKSDGKDLPKVPDATKFWTYVTCAKNKKELKHINLDGKCGAFKK